MRAALLQLTSGDDPRANLDTVLPMLRDAADQGAQIALTPEVTNCVSLDRAHQRTVLEDEEDDIFLTTLKSEAARLGLDAGQSWSCYDPVGEGADALHCGSCDACRLRAKGYIDAGIPDPTRYAASPA